MGDDEEGNTVLHQGLASLLMQESRECEKAGYYVPGPEEVIAVAKDGEKEGGKLGLL